MLGQGDSRSGPRVRRVATAEARKSGLEFRVNTYTTGDQDQAHVSADADGNFVVVWRSYGDGSQAASIVGQRFDRIGNEAGRRVQGQRLYERHTSRRPRWPWTPSGAFVVAWQSQGQDGSSGPESSRVASTRRAHRSAFPSSA